MLLRIHTPGPSNRRPILAHIVLFLYTLFNSHNFNGFDHFENLENSDRLGGSMVVIKFLHLEIYLDHSVPFESAMVAWLSTRYLNFFVSFLILAFTFVVLHFKGR